MQRRRVPAALSPAATHATSQGMQTCFLDTLTAGAFGAYGEVFPSGGVTTRVDHVARLENRRPEARPNLFMARTTLTALPHAFDRMESHPWSSQSFMPLGDAALVVAVALRGRDGAPDMTTLRAFLAAGTGFSYRTGVWHLPIASVKATVPVLGFMYEDGTPEDCVWADVPPTQLAPR